MSFFPILAKSEQKAKPGRLRTQDIETLHRMECSACPLSTLKENRNPNMTATGSDEPLIYMLGEAPGATEDEEGEQFVGDSGDIIRGRIPNKMRQRLRWNNVVRTRPPGNRTPSSLEIECCRPSVERDIAKTKPKVIVGFGNTPLEWVTKGGFSGITTWRGRRMPVTIAGHTCWYYPMVHPAAILRNGRPRDADPRRIFNEDDRMLYLDLKRMFKEAEELPLPIVHTPEQALRNIECITRCDEEDLRRIREQLNYLSRQVVIGIDYETSGLRPYDPEKKILTAAVGTGDYALSFPFDHPHAGWSPEHRAELAEIWIEFLRTAKAIKAVHNLAFELEWTGERFDKSLLRAGRWECTMQQAATLDERSRGGGGTSGAGPLSLEFLVQQHFGFNIKKLANVDRGKLAQTPLIEVLTYNGLDARYHCLLWRRQHAAVKNNGLQEAERLAQRRVPAMTVAQLAGIPVRHKTLKILAKKYEERIAALEAAIEKDPVVKKFEARQRKKYSWSSGPDNIALFHKMLQRDECVIYDKRKRDNKLSANEDVLEQIDMPLAKNIIQVRKATKRLGTYIYPLMPDKPHSVLWPDGMLHPTYNTAFAETGRISAEGPNVQNFPARDGEAKEVRKPVVPRKGCVIVAVDYGQIEARVIGMASKDKKFCKYLWDRRDIHMEWAQNIAEAYPRRIGGPKMLKDKAAMKAFRTDIKNQWTFPLVFGASLPSVSSYLNIPEDVLEPLIDEFWEDLPEVHDWQNRQLEFYYQHGYVECLTGRRRRGPLSVNMVYNSPIQGTAGEIMLDGMCTLSELGDPRLQPEINIHDDLTFLSVPENEVDECIEKIVDTLLYPPFDFINVPITVEVKVGKNWLEMEEVGTFASDTWRK